MADRTVPVVVEHDGDAALRDRLVRAMQVWHDAGDFLVGAADADLVETLERRGTRAHLLPEIAGDDELFVVDLSDADVCARLGTTARLVYSHGRQGLVALVAGTTPRPTGFEPGRVSHGGIVAVTRQAWAPQGVGEALAARLSAVQKAGPDARITALVAAASSAGMQADVQMLSSNHSRNSGVPAYIDAARDQIVGRLQSMGYAPQLVPFSSSHGDNIQVELTGAARPDEWVVIGAHYDSFTFAGKYASAPGADDNASGSAAVLEIARVLAAAGPFERSIRLLWFAGEEYGLYGSKAAAAASAASGEQVFGMLNLDMTAYRASGGLRDVDLITNTTSPVLTDLCDTAGALYVPGWTSKRVLLSAGSSDHAAYTLAGFPSLFPFEDVPHHSPFIHTAGDTHPQSTPDFDLALMITRGVLATAAVLAEPADLRIDHSPLPDTTNAAGPYGVTATVTSQIGTTVSAATLHYSAAGEAFSAVPMVQSGADWSAPIPSQGSPTTISYFITAVDDAGHGQALPAGADLGRQPFSFFVGVEQVLYATGFEGPGDEGWTHGASVGYDDWQRAAPQGTSGDPSAAFEGLRAWGNDLNMINGNGAYPKGVDSWLRSPLVNCSQATNVTLSFRRWLTVEAGPNDQAFLRVNGQLVWQSPNGVDLVDTGWVPVSIDVSSIAAGSPAVQVEFGLHTDAGLVFGGWNLDAFELTERTPGMGGCLPPLSYCTPKLNSQDCLPRVHTTGTPSVSSSAPFQVTAVQVVNGKSGVLFYGSAADSKFFQSGTLCVAPPLKRLGPLTTGGNPPPDDCSGVLTYDFNALIQSGADPALVQGVTVYCQFWYRDPKDTFGYGTGLSDAMSFTICP